MTSQKFILVPVLFFVIVFIFTTGCDKAKSDWEKAKLLHTVDAYKEFLSKHPQSKFAEKAKERIEELEWNIVLKANTLEDYEKFLSIYPRGKFADECKRRIEAIEWGSVKEVHTIEAYQRFLSQYPESDFVKLAQEKISELKKAEELDWQKVLKQNTVKAFRDFIKKYPQSKRLPSFVGTIKEVLVPAFNPSDISLTLVEHPSIEFKTNLWDAVDYGLVEQKPIEGFPFFSNYNIVDYKGWRVKLICTRKKNYYDVIIFKKLKKNIEK